MRTQPTGRITLLIAATVMVTGAIACLIAGAIGGMAADELRKLAVLLAPAIVVTTAVALLSEHLLARRSLRRRFMAVALLALAASLLNLTVLVLVMSVNHHDAVLISITMLYSLAAGIGAAFAAARVSSAQVERVTQVAHDLGGGDLSARVGAIDDGPELNTLAATLDEMAERLQDSIESERSAEAQRRDLITAISHDLRTPLASLRAMVEAIDDGVVDDVPTVRRYVAEMQRSVGSLTTLVDDLFELVQLDAGAIEAETQRARLDEVMESALASCRGQATEKGLSVEARVTGSEDYPCSPRLVRVLQNLLQNAIRHTPSDGAVLVFARPCDDGLELVVEDSGEGISPEALDHVFEPFWRGDSSRTGPGSGLGLALAKRIVEALGGQIEVQSEIARGSRFAVVLPNER
jgi:signal transduction histidine kinase